MSIHSSTDGLVCPNHPEARLVEDYRAGDVVCPHCGVIVAERAIDVAAEWRTFSSDTDSKDLSRVGAAYDNLQNEETALSTMIGFQRNVSGSAGGAMRFRNRTIMSSADRSLSNGLKEARAMVERLSLPQSVLMRTEALYRRVRNSHGLRGRSHFAVVSACVYIACRKENATRSLKEVSAVSQADKRDVGRCFKQILNILKENVEMIKIEDFIARFCVQLNLSNDIRNVASQLCSRVSETDIASGRAPLSIASAAIFMTAALHAKKLDVSEISKVSGAAESTIKATYRVLHEKAHVLLPKDKTFPVPVHRLPPTA